MTFTLGIAQTQHPQDMDIPKMVRDWAQQAKNRGVDLLVFPEALMTRYEEKLHDYLSAAQTLDGPYCSALNSIAAEFGLWMVYTVNELHPAGGKPYNTAVIVDSAGKQQGIYRKTHLFDTDFTQESSRMSAGPKLFDPIDTPFGRIGLGICYDLRFPELARSSALAGAQLMLYPAAWVSGNTKAEQWRTLVAARAIENQMYVAGISRCDDTYIGQSCVAAPDGHFVASAGPKEELLVCSIDLEAIDAVRAGMPVLSHRRPELY